MAQASHAINKFLVEIFNDILKTEELLIAKKYKDLSVKEMHVIEQVCLAEENNEDTRVTEIAKKLRLTAGTLTAAVIPLEKKGYLTRIKDEKDKRVVKLLTTDLGKEAQVCHVEFHKEMIEGVLSVITDEQAWILTQSLSGLRNFFEEKYHV